MKDEDRDPELEFVRANWDAPPPSAGFHQRVGAAYDREFGGAARRPRWIITRLVLPAAAAAALALTLFTAAHKQPAYRPVFQPRFIVISQGEHP